MVWKLECKMCEISRLRILCYLMCGFALLIFVEIKPLFTMFPKVYKYLPSNIFPAHAGCNQHSKRPSLPSTLTEIISWQRPNTLGDPDRPHHAFFCSSAARVQRIQGEFFPQGSCRVGFDFPVFRLHSSYYSNLVLFLCPSTVCLPCSVVRFWLSPLHPNISPNRHWHSPAFFILTLPEYSLFY